MHNLDTILIPATTTIALSSTSGPAYVSRVVNVDVIATVVGSNPANKTFTAVDQSADTAAIVAHGFLTGTKVTLTTTGGLPTGLATSTPYYLIAVDADTIAFATSQANALAGTKIDLSSAGTGTQTVVVTTTLAGTIKLQKCNDPINDPNITPKWVDLNDKEIVDQSNSKTISAAADFNWVVQNTGTAFLRIVVTITSGTVTCYTRCAGKGW